MYHLDVRKQEEFKEEKNPTHVSDLIKTAVLVIFSFKKKSLLMSVFHHSLEGSKLFTMFT